MRNLTASARSWIFYHPFDLPEYMYIGWKGVPETVLERVSGATIKSADVPLEFSEKL